MSWLASWLRYWRELHTYRRLLRRGQRLASERDDLIAQGADPTTLRHPLAPIKPRRPT